MNELISQNITCDKKNRTARSRHSSLHFVPTTNIFITNLLLKRIIKIGDKGKRF
jgi:hypothetical protein